MDVGYLEFGWNFTEKIYCITLCNTYSLAALYLKKNLVLKWVAAQISTKFGI